MEINWAGESRSALIQVGICSWITDPLFNWGDLNRIDQRYLDVNGSKFVYIRLPLIHHGSLNIQPSKCGYKLSRVVLFCLDSVRDLFTVYGSPAELSAARPCERTLILIWIKRASDNYVHHCPSLTFGGCGWNVVIVKFYCAYVFFSTFCRISEILTILVVTR